MMPVKDVVGTDAVICEKFWSVPRKCI